MHRLHVKKIKSCTSWGGFQRDVGWFVSFRTLAARPLLRGACDAPEGNIAPTALASHHGVGLCRGTPLPRFDIAWPCYDVRFIDQSAQCTSCTYGQGPDGYPVLHFTYPRLARHGLAFPPHEKPRTKRGISSRSWSRSMYGGTGVRGYWGTAAPLKLHLTLVDLFGAQW